MSENTQFLSTVYGTPLYLSPEQVRLTSFLSPRPHLSRSHRTHGSAPWTQVRNEPYNQSADIWSLGVLLYEVATLRPPFEAPNMIVLAQRIDAAQFSPPKVAAFSPLSLLYIVF
jgi:serine/threonine protein kinase